jgi:hypothetical protein
MKKGGSLIGVERGQRVRRGAGPGGGVVTGEERGVCLALVVAATM